MDCSRKLFASLKVLQHALSVASSPLFTVVTDVIHRNLVALALGQKLAILAAQDVEVDQHSTVSISACSIPEQITTLCWLAYASYNAEEEVHLQDVCLLLGTSLGYLQLHAEDGQLLHRQRLHTTSAQAISVRVAGMGLKPDDGSEDVSITFSDSIVRLSSLSIRSLVRQQLQIRRWDDDSPSSPLSYNIWDLRRAGPRSAGVCAGLKPHSLYATLTGRDTHQKLLLLTAGRDPALAAYEAEEVLQRGSLAFVSSLASSVASGVFGVAKAAAWGRQAGFRAGLRNWVAAKVIAEQPGSPRAAKDDEKLPKGESVTLFRSLKDGPRAVDRLLLAPRGPLAVASDSFGRVLLIDVISVTVVRIWKSYRDAQFGWIMCSSSGGATQTQRSSTDQPMSHQAHPGKRRRSDQETQDGGQAPQTTQQQPGILHLVLYAPRRRALELWQMRSGLRVATVQVASACKLLQRSLSFGLKFDCTDSNFGGQIAALAVGQCLIVDIVSGHTVDVLSALQFQTTATA
ncbi:hypothetical protein ABBQ38_010003 [Trebouxia sp. C0009 RCD-2024]